MRLALIGHAGDWKAFKDGVTGSKKGGQIRLVCFDGEAMMLVEMVSGYLDCPSDVSKASHPQNNIKLRFQSFKGRLPGRGIDHRSQLIAKLSNVGGHQYGATALNPSATSFHAGADHQPVAVPVIRRIGKLALVHPKAKPQK